MKRAGRHLIEAFIVLILILAAVASCGQTQPGTLRWKFETEGSIVSSPSIGADGTIYVGSDDGNLYAIASDSKGLADSPWPKFRGNLRNTGRYGDK